LKRILLLLSLLCFSIQAYAASSVSIWPVKVALWPEKKLDVIHLVNQGNDAVKVQIYATSWDMDENGQFIEADTGDFVFFPRLATIAPNEEKEIRVGYNGAFPALEKAYRLYLEELPPIQQPTPEEAQKSTLEIQMTLKLSVPLFVRPAADAPTPQPLIKAAQTTGQGLQVAIHNEGTHNFLLKNGSVELLNSQDRSIFSGPIKVLQRVLPKRRLFVNVPLANAPCAKANAIEFKFTLDDQEEPYIKRFPTQKGCTPVL